MIERAIVMVRRDPAGQVTALAWTYGAVGRDDAAVHIHHRMVDYYVPLQGGGRASIRLEPGPTLTTNWDGTGRNNLLDLPHF